MRVINGSWIRPAYPGDGPSIARLAQEEESGAKELGASHWERLALDQFRRPRFDRALWVVEGPLGDLSGIAAFAASLGGEPELANFYLNPRAAADDFACDEVASALQACALASMARAGATTPRAIAAEAVERKRLRAEFAPVMRMPASPMVLDLAQGRDNRNRPGDWSIGRYNEKRRGMYTSALFAGERNVHIGLDLGGPVGTSIHAFASGEIWATAYNGEIGSYGYTIVSRHCVGERALFALFGHLSARSIEGKYPGQPIARGEAIAHIGDVRENGGWEHPHLHLQLSWAAPAACDMPGTATDAGLAAALLAYPDPFLVTGLP
jgi:murein DD-endopeptidase MepM/ murein hydrolase activator NlpD